jgi:quercetin dioxygenase-like cupin family protein
MSQVFKLDQTVQFQTGTVVSRVLMGGKGHKGTVTTFAFSAGEGLSEHSAPFDALVINLHGTGKVTLEGEPHILEKGDAIVMPANIPHAVYAQTDFKMMLVMIRDE